MTPYINYIRALKTGATVKDYNHSMRLTRLATVRGVCMAWVVPADADSYTEYRYAPPAATVNENLTVASETVLAVVAETPVTVPNLVDTEVHLWNDYPTGKRPTMGKWKVLARLTGDWYTLEYKPTAQTVTRTRAQLCTQDEYAAYVAGVKAAA